MNYLQKKKLAFMSIVNRVKGFIRTITGALPLTLEGCVDEDSIIDYTLYGQSVQNGTPTPDTPVEVESVGEKTRNLFNPKQTPVQIGNYLGMELESDIYTLRIALKNNKNVPSGVYFGLLYGSHASWLITNGNVQQKQTSLDLSTYTGISVAVYSASGNTKAWNSIIDAFDIYLSEGYDTTYEPYGYKIPITVTGKNLLPYPYHDTTKTINGITFTDNGDGTIAASGTATRSAQLRLMNWTTFDKTKKYYISGSPSGSSWSTHGIYISFWLNGTWKNELLEKGNGLLLDLPNMTVEFNQIQINCVVWNGATVENITFKPQLEEGSTATDYEPYHEPITTNIYLDEPLGAGQSINYKKDSLPPLPTFKGTSIISADTTVQPSNAEITYYSNVKE